jgi:hypothetical protein
MDSHSCFTRGFAEVFLRSEAEPHSAIIMKFGGRNLVISPSKSSADAQQEVSTNSDREDGCLARSS